MSTPDIAAPTTTAGAAKETLEDYTLRFAPRSYRRWGTGTVAISALGGIAYLADFAIGANIGISYGTVNALWGIAVFAVVIFATGFPLAYYAARYNLDLDLITRGSGFGYYGSVVTNVIFATFTFIFFALEGSIMAQGLKLGLGRAALARLRGVDDHHLPAGDVRDVAAVQAAAVDHAAVAGADGRAVRLPAGQPPRVGRDVLRLPGRERAGRARPRRGVPGRGRVPLAHRPDRRADRLPALHAAPDPGELPPLVDRVVLAGPGWVLFGAVKQIVGLFLAVYIIANVADGAAVANQPVHQFLMIYREIMPPWAAMALAVVLVVISQIKINVTNAYSGSLAWTNSFTRVTKHYPGRLVFLGVNLLIALVLMEANMFDFLNTILGFYANCGMSWVVVVATDIAVNKYLLKISPMRPEFRRGMLYAVNPVGFGSMIISAGVSIVVFFGGLGPALQPFSPLVAIVLAMVLPPVLALATRGRYYLRRTDDGIDAPMEDEHGNPSGLIMQCHVCREQIERPDLAACAAHDAVVCSLCLSQDKTGEHVLPAQV